VTLPANVAGGTSTAYNADNEQTKFNGTSLSYDANGNLTSDGTYTYIYGLRNQLNQIKQGSTVVASIAYDGLGRRQVRVVGTNATQYLYDGLNPVQELNGGAPPVPTANLLTGLGIDEYFTRTDSSGNVSSLLRDALGSTIGLVGSGGTIATNYTYQPFGATTVGGSANGNSYEFTDRENDGTGLYFNRMRCYSPTFQRFIGQDPIDFTGGINLYAYALNNPISLHDLLGLCGGATPDPPPNATPTSSPPTTVPLPISISPQFGECLLGAAGDTHLIIVPFVCGGSTFWCLQAEAPGLNLPGCRHRKENTRVDGIPVHHSSHSSFFTVG
jgi:RHS repeat-associated protein